MESFRFAHPEYFYLMLVIPAFVVLFILSRLSRLRSLRLFGDRALIAQLMPSASGNRPFIKFTIWMLALAFIIGALAQPQFGSKLVTSKRKGVELIIALDVSNSMMAEDIKPNRLERAKRAIAKLTERLRNDKIGLIVFAGQAYVQLPITTDYVSAKLFLDAINTGIVPVQGTAIGAAIQMAMKSFTPEFTGSKAVIVITDGENHEDDAIGAAKEALEKKIIVHTIGMGLPQGAPIPIGGPGSRDFLKDKQNNIVVTKLDENMLTQIATAGGGTYIRANNEYNDQFPLFLTLALILIMIDFMILDRKNKWLRNFRLFGNQK